MKNGLAEKKSHKKRIKSLVMEEERKAEQEQ